MGKYPWKLVHLKISMTQDLNSKSANRKMPASAFHNQAKQALTQLKHDIKPIPPPEICQIRCSSFRESGFYIDQCSPMGSLSCSTGRAHLSSPAHATMTPLSVHRMGEGQTSFIPACSETWLRELRTLAFAATPPATTKWRKLGKSSLTQETALLHRCARC